MFCCTLPCQQDVKWKCNDNVIQCYSHFDQWHEHAWTSWQNSFCKHLQTMLPPKLYWYFYYLLHSFTYWVRQTWLNLAACRPWTWFTSPQWKNWQVRLEWVGERYQQEFGKQESANILLCICMHLLSFAYPLISAPCFVWHVPHDVSFNFTARAMLSLWDRNAI